MWLLGRLVPDHKTIADFRKDNGGGIKKVCARFVELCRRMGLLSTASVAIDGSKFKSREQPGQEFHERENRAAAQAIGRECIAVSESARHGRSTGSVGDADVEEGADQVETGKTEIGNLQAGGDREAGASFTGSADLIDRSR
jgi:hypothetical protein